MSGLQAVLLAVVVAVQLVCAVALLFQRDPFDRLHLVGPVSVLATAVLVVAVLISASSTSHAAKVVVVGLLAWLTSPMSNRVTARALRIRAAGRLAVEHDDDVEEASA